jgi:hypothetical protein
MWGGAGGSVRGCLLSGHVYACMAVVVCMHERVCVQRASALGRASVTVPEHVCAFAMSRERAWGTCAEQQRSHRRQHRPLPRALTQDDAAAANSVPFFELTMRSPFAASNGNGDNDDDEEEDDNHELKELSARASSSAGGGGSDSGGASGTAQRGAEEDAPLTDNAVVLAPQEAEPGLLEVLSWGAGVCACWFL